MNRVLLFLAIAFIAIGVVGEASLAVVRSSVRFNTRAVAHFGTQRFGMMGRGNFRGMMNPRGMIGRGNFRGMMNQRGMMGRGNFRGMMNPRGMMGRGNFRGMMNPRGMMGRGRFGWMMRGHLSGMINPRGVTPRNTVPRNVTPLTLDQAVARAQQYITSLNNNDFALTEVMEFSNHFYAETKEKSSGVHAFEFLIDKNRGRVSPEPGPNMMWNTKYSPMTRMMRGFQSSPTTQNSLTPAQAKEKAQQYLDTNQKGTKVSDEVDAFYGYYTLHVMRDGKIVGMLSVHGTTGAVWYHNWHGTFVNMRELG